MGEGGVGVRARGCGRSLRLRVRGAPPSPYGYGGIAVRAPAIARGAELAVAARCDRSLSLAGAALASLASVIYQAIVLNL